MQTELLIALIITALLFGIFIVILIVAGKKVDKETKQQIEEGKISYTSTAHTEEEIVALYNYCVGKINNKQLKGSEFTELYEATTKVGFMLDNPFNPLDCNMAYFILMNALPLDDQIKIRYGLWYTD